MATPVENTKRFYLEHGLMAPVVKWNMTPYWAGGIRLYASNALYALFVTTIDITPGDDAYTYTLTASIHD
jgi:hypothetical protein